jgi:hypothetical protein
MQTCTAHVCDRHWSVYHCPSPPTALGTAIDGDEGGDGATGDKPYARSACTLDRCAAGRAVWVSDRQGASIMKDTALTIRSSSKGRRLLGLLICVLFGAGCAGPPQGRVALPESAAPPTCPRSTRLWPRRPSKRLAPRRTTAWGLRTFWRSRSLTSLRAVALPRERRVPYPAGEMVSK